MAAEKVSRGSGAGNTLKDYWGKEESRSAEDGSKSKVIAHSLALVVSEMFFTAEVVMG